MARRTRLAALALLALPLLPACGGADDAAAPAAAAPGTTTVGTAPATTDDATAEDARSDPPATAEDAMTAGASATAPGAGDADVEVTVRPEGPAGAATRYRLRCGADGPWLEPAGQDGALPAGVDAGAACAALAADVAALAPVPASAACTAIDGGPAVASIVGTVAGEEVDAALSRAGGCEIDRWDRLAAVVGPAAT